jgi:hypothetical protein
MFEPESLKHYYEPSTPPPPTPLQHAKYLRRNDPSSTYLTVTAEDKENIERQQPLSKSSEVMYVLARSVDVVFYVL